jgi:hypothetical protein
MKFYYALSLLLLISSSEAKLRNIIQENEGLVGNELDSIERTYYGRQLRDDEMPKMPKMAKSEDAMKTVPVSAGGRVACQQYRNPNALVSIHTHQFLSDTRIHIIIIILPL